MIAIDWSPVWVVPSLLPISSIKAATHPRWEIQWEFNFKTSCRLAPLLASQQSRGGVIAATPLVLDHMAHIAAVTPPYVRIIILKSYFDPKFVFSCRSSSSVSIFNLLRNYASRDHHTSSRPMR
jgi:hypothetical protein